MYDSVIAKGIITPNKAKELNNYGDKCIEYSTNFVLACPLTDEELVLKLKDHYSAINTFRN